MITTFLLKALIGTLIHKQKLTRQTVLINFWLQLGGSSVHNSGKVGCRTESIPITLQYMLKVVIFYKDDLWMVKLLVGTLGKGLSEWKKWQKQSHDCESIYYFKDS